MAKVLDELVKLLALERIEENLFRGESQNLGWGTVFGGQVLGQALSAAAQTLAPDRHAHSLHAYFLRPGDVAKPIVYEVDRSRDGHSFSSRRVVAIQGGAQILTMLASFQVNEPGFEHQVAMPAAPSPAAFLADAERVAKYTAKLPDFVVERARADRPFEIRSNDPEVDPFAPPPREGNRMLWMRAVARLPDDPALHRYLLAYVSDFTFVTTSLAPHGVTYLSPGMHVASIDHAMWFHQPFRCDDWLLHCIESPAAHGARGFVRGHVFTQDGRLVASTAQEGLIRHRP